MQSFCQYPTFYKYVYIADTLADTGCGAEKERLVAVSVLHLNDRQCRIVIDAEITIDTVMELKDDLLFPLAKYNEIEIDLAGVSEIDVCGLQLLVRVKVVATVHGKSLRIVSHSYAVLALLRQCDLKRFFCYPVTNTLQ